MANENDLTFGFDTSYFEKGIDKVVKGMGTVQNTTMSMAKGVSKGLTAVAVKFGAVFAGVKAIKGALNNMPEIGQAFGIAKDVFLKNLLFPLRKEVFPLLQDLLNWVRDSRGTFTKWGQSLADVFATVVSTIKGVVKFAKGLGKSISDLTEKIFGDRIKGINNIFNILTFKMATLVQFASLMIENIGSLFQSFILGIGDISDPVNSIVDSFFKMLNIFTAMNDGGNSFKNILSSIGTFLGKMVNFVVEITASFMEGLLPAIKNIATPIQGIVDALASISDLIFTSTDSLKTWKPIFKGIGDIIGGALTLAFKGIEIYVRSVEETIKLVKNLIDSLTQTDLFKNMQSGIRGFFDNIPNPFSDSNISNPFSDSKPKKVNDAILRPNGEVIETNPKDTLVAMKDVKASSSSLGGAISKVFDIKISPTIVIQQGTEAQGQAVALGLMDTLEQQFNREFERGGY